MADIAPNLREMLSKPSEEIERPKALPTCYLLGTITGTEFTKTRGSMEDGVLKQTDLLRVVIRATGAGPGTDEPVLDELKKIDLGKREFRKDFFLTPAALYRTADMLDAVLGKAPGRGMDERIPELRSASVLFQVLPRTNRDGSIAEGFNDIGTIVAA